MKKRFPEPKWHDTWIGESAICAFFGLTVTLLQLLVEWFNGIAPSIWGTLSTFVGTTIAVLIFAIRKRVGELEINVREHNSELEVGEETDNLLMQLQARLREVQAHRTELFKTYCKQELKRFVARVARAAQQGELIVNEHHFSTVNDVLEAFAGGKSRVFRAVWIIEDEEPLFDMAWQHYMKELVLLAQSRSKRKRITVELLLVVDKMETLDRLAVEIVVGYLRSAKAKAKGINYQIITNGTYEELVHDGGLDAQYVDFGVYGERLLYRTKTYEPKQGMFSEDESAIETYRQTHEAAMKSAMALETPKGAKEHDNLEKFLHADEIEEKEYGKNREGTIQGSLVKIATGDGHQLDGILYEAKESIATVLHVHGSLGNFYHQPFVQVFAKTLTREGINLLSCNMRTHDGIAEGYNADGDMEYVGGSLARFETCVKDIQGTVRWCRKLGPKVYLQGHSLGCDRVLHYLESTKAALSPILLSPCDSLQLQKEWLGEEEFRQQQAALRERREKQSTEAEEAWNWAAPDAYGVKGEDDWTYQIPVTEGVLESIQLGAVGRILAVEMGGAEIGKVEALAYMGRTDRIRGASIEAMKKHLQVLLPNVEVIEGEGGHNMEECEEDTAKRVAGWIRKMEDEN